MDDDSGPLTEPWFQIDRILRAFKHMDAAHLATIKILEAENHLIKMKLKKHEEGPSEFSNLTDAEIGFAQEALDQARRDAENPHFLAEYHTAYEWIDSTHAWLKELHTHGKCVPMSED